MISTLNCRGRHSVRAITVIVSMCILQPQPHCAPFVLKGWFIVYFVDCGVFIVLFADHHCLPHSLLSS